MSLDFSLYADQEGDEPSELFWANITHNLTEMADAAGIYEPLWRPDELGVKAAGELVELLREGLKRLEGDPAHFQQFNSPNGWGLYKHFVPFVRNVLTACETHPAARVHVSR